MNIRKSNDNDLNEIFNLHLKCFDTADCLYKATFISLLANGIVIEKENKIVSFLSQELLSPCDILPLSMESIDNTNDKYLENLIENTTNEIKYDVDNFIPVNEIGISFKMNNNHIKPMYGISLIFVEREFRNTGIASAMISYHIEHNEKPLCLHVRKSNLSAISLYNKLGYIYIADIKNKYYNPTEDSSFYIHN